jgi:hypothetical protein
LQLNGIFQQTAKDERDHAPTHQKRSAAVRPDQYNGTYRVGEVARPHANRLVMASTDIFTVSRLLRHETLAVTLRYAHLADTHLQQAVERLGQGVTASDTVPQKTVQDMSQTIN